MYRDMDLWKILRLKMDFSCLQKSEKGRVDSYFMLRLAAGLDCRKGKAKPPGRAFLNLPERMQKMKASTNLRKPFLFQIFIIQNADSG